MLAQFHEAFDHEPLEFGKCSGVLPAEQLDILGGHLEAASFAVDVPGRVAEQKAEVNVDHVALRVEQDVPIVSVLDLQNVAEKGVAGRRLQEVVASLGIAFAGDASLELLGGA